MNSGLCCLRFVIANLLSLKISRHPRCSLRHCPICGEDLILKDLVKGLPNKIIARKLDIAEATVKVHMKSVLRKVRVANRTQAAIWALENGYAANNLHPELPRLEAVQLAPLSLLSPSAT